MRSSIHNTARKFSVVFKDPELTQPLLAKDLLARRAAEIAEQVRSEYDSRIDPRERLKSAITIHTLASSAISILEVLKTSIPELEDSLKLLQGKKRVGVEASEKLKQFEANQAYAIYIHVVSEIINQRADSLRNRVEAIMRPIKKFLEKIGELEGTRSFTRSSHKEIFSALSLLQSKATQEDGIALQDLDPLKKAERQGKLESLTGSLHTLIEANSEESVITQRESKILKLIEAANDTFAASAEARALKLIALVQEREPSREGVTNDEKKLASKLSASGLGSVDALTAQFAGRLLLRDEDTETLRKIFQTLQSVETATNNKAQDDKPTTTATDQTVPDRSESTITETQYKPRYQSQPPTDEELAFREEYLKDLGVHDPNVLGQMTKDFSSESIEQLITLFRVIPANVKESILAFNPWLLCSFSKSELSDYVTSLERILADSRVDRTRFPVFDPIKHPLHFSSPELLKRTAAAFEVVVNGIINAERLNSRKA
jgi:hypothetical protein